MQTATADPLVGRRLEGRYRLMDRIARGGMSTVYAALDERLDRMVAVKVMSSGLSADPAFSDRFAREARAAARLTHVNVVSVYDQGHEVGADGHHVFLVMELVEGRTLRDLLHERGRLSPAEAVSIMEPVLSALLAAHRAGLVHRDVKPENILLSDHGVVKVADFGLARATETDASSTRTGLMMGTVAYCSPEQLSDGNCDPRSDVYSAGVVFFELLTGSPPYQGETAMNVAYQHVHSRVPAPSSRVREVPAEIDEIVVAATDSDPTGRPNDAGALLAELAEARATLGLPVVAVPPRPRPADQWSTRRPVRRGPDPAGAPGYDTQATSMLSAEPARGRYDTTVTPGLSGERTPATGGRGAPPRPPVVLSPARQQKLASKRRRRRTVIGLLLVVVVGLGAFFGTRAVIAWRFAHVPDVHGLSRDAAVSALRQAGYDAQLQPGPEYSEKIDKGKVIGTDPSSGSRLATGKTVTIAWSAGPHLYSIPATAGRDQTTARRLLAAAGGLQVSKVTQTSNDTVKKGLVIGTSPAAGQQVRKGVPITLIVSTGPPIVSIPDIARGTDADSAEQTLRDAGFTVHERQVFNSDTSSGEVVAISPTGQAPKFSTITVNVSKGPRLVAVPQIATGLGSNVDQAQDAVKAAGLVPQVQSSYGGPGPDLFHNYVRSVSPGSGEMVPVGSTVTITTF